MNTGIKALEDNLLDAADKVGIAKENLSYVQRFVSAIIARLPADDEESHAPAHTIIAMDCILERIEDQLQNASDILNRLRGAPSDDA